MRLYGIIGWKNSGKTTLMERLVAGIAARGYSVSTLKHAHHAVDVDQPGKDSHRHRAAGASEVLLASASRWALMRELRGAPEPPLADLLARLSPVDLVLIEGWKRDSHPKVEVWRAATGVRPIAAEDPTVRAIATPDALPDLGGRSLRRLDLDNAAEVADFILAECGLLTHKAG